MRLSTFADNKKPLGGYRSGCPALVMVKPAH